MPSRRVVVGFGLLAGSAGLMLLVQARSLTKLGEPGSKALQAPRVELRTAAAPATSAHEPPTTRPIPAFTPGLAAPASNDEPGVPGITKDLHDSSARKAIAATWGTIERMGLPADQAERLKQLELDYLRDLAQLHRQTRDEESFARALQGVRLRRKVLEKEQRSILGERLAEYDEIWTEISNETP